MNREAEKRSPVLCISTQKALMFAGRSPSAGPPPLAALISRNGAIAITPLGPDSLCSWSGCISSALKHPSRLQ